MKRGRNIIWTEKNRELMYTELNILFGPHSTWGLKIRPNNNSEYLKFKKEFAKKVGAKSHQAVQQQIEFATSKQDYLSGFLGHINCLFANKLIAFKCGFIDESYLPEEIVISYSSNKKCKPNKTNKINNKEKEIIKLEKEIRKELKINQQTPIYLLSEDIQKHIKQKLRSRLNEN